MRRRLAGSVAATLLALAFGHGVRGATARVSQADGGGAVSPGTNTDSVKTYFDRARMLGFPAAGQRAPYVLRAEFTTRGSSGEVQTGTYTDTWLNDKKWRREAVLGKSYFVRSRDGKKFYRSEDGPDAALLQFVLTAMEPIPSTTSIKASDWKIEQDQVDGVATTSVARGKESREGTADPKKFEGYWFDETGQLVKSTLDELQTARSKFEDFNGLHVARLVQVTVSGKVGMRIDVTDLQPAGTVDSHIFAIKGHDWVPMFTSEVR